MSDVFVSICIPAFKRVQYLTRLLNSIEIQEYRDFEVIVTDDSPGDEVKTICDSYSKKFSLNYYKNLVSLGTPENWNQAIRNAKGSWIKLMHDDDWFSSSRSLGKFVDYAKQNPQAFILSWYTNVYFKDNREEKVKTKGFRIRQLLKDPLTLLSRNIIGPPSVTMHRRDPAIFYDKNLKWLVDIDYYQQRLQIEKPVIIEEYLVHVGLSEEQVTMICHYNPEVELPENNYLLKKTGNKHLRNMLVYDAWWRLFRNLEIKTGQLENYKDLQWPHVVHQILSDVNKVPRWMITKGIFSKILMTFSYFKNRSLIK